jgi:integrase
MDPGIQKRRDKIAAKSSAAATFKSIAIEHLNNRRHTVTPLYADQILRRLEADIFPALGNRRIADIDAPELLRVLRKIEKRGVLEQAKRLRQTCGQIFRFAIVTGRAQHDPSSALKGALKPKGRPRHHTPMARHELPTSCGRSMATTVTLARPSPCASSS